MTAPRVVSLVPSLSETLLGWGIAPVGVTDYCVWPAGGFPTARRVRGTKNPDTAAIVALHPDLVVADQEENRELDVQRLRAAGLEVHVTRVRGVADVAAELEALGARVGRVQAARTLADAVRRAHAGVLPAAPARRTFCPIWRDGAQHARSRAGEEQWWAVGRDTYAGDLLAAVGLAVWPDDPTGRYPQVTLDEVRAADVEVVLLPDEPYAFGPDDHRALVSGDGSSPVIRHVHGTALVWWGPRTPGALADLAALARGLGRPSGVRAASEGSGARG